MLSLHIQAKTLFYCAYENGHVNILQYLLQHCQVPVNIEVGCGWHIYTNWDEDHIDDDYDLVEILPEDHNVPYILLVRMDT